MRKVVTFILGMLFGIIFLFATIGIGGYIFMSSVNVGQFTPSDYPSDSLGDFANMSLLDIAKEIADIYNKENIKTPDENGHYFTLADFEEKYKINLSQATGIQFSDNTKALPVFTLMTPDGLAKAMETTSIAAITDLVNSLQPDGNMFGDELTAELEKHPISDLMGENPLSVLDNVLVNWIVPDMATTESALMFAVGNCTVGGLINAATGGNIFLAIKTEETLAPLGTLKLADLLAGVAEGNNLVADILGEKTVADFISETGDFDLNYLIADFRFGAILGLHRTEEEITLDNLLDYTAEAHDADSKTTVYSKTDEESLEKNYFLADGDKWYQAELNCQESHSHIAECFDYIWLTVEDNRASVVYSALASLTPADLQDGDLLNKLLDRLTLGDVLGADNLTGIFASFKDVKIGNLAQEIEKMYIGKFLGYEFADEVTDTSGYTTEVFNDAAKDIRVITNGTDFAKTLDGKTWYSAEKQCQSSDEHTCSSSCYSIWKNSSGYASGVILMIADETVSGLSNLDFGDKIGNLTIADVLGEANVSSGILKALSHTKISELSDKINTLQLGELLGYTYDEETSQWFDGTEPLSGLTLKLADKTITDLQDINGLLNDVTLGDVISDTSASGVLNALKDTKIGELADAVNNLQIGEILGYELRGGKWFNGSEQITGATAKIADQTINDLQTNGFNGVINELTLRDVMGDTVDGNSILKSLADTDIGSLGNAMNSLYIGQIMGYERKSAENADLYTQTIVAVDSQAVVKSNTNGNYIKIQDGTWYNAAISCTDSHAHTADCFAVIWYTDGTSAADGITKALVNMQVTDLTGNGLQSAINNLTLTDVLGEENLQSGILSSLKNTKISEMSEAIDNTYLGNVLSMYRKEISSNTVFTPVTATNAIRVVYSYSDGSTTKFAILNNGDNKYYEAIYKCRNSAHTDTTHMHECFEQAWYDDAAFTAHTAVLNQGLADMTLGNINAEKIAVIVGSMTIQDMMDNKIISISQENQDTLDDIMGDTDWRSLPTSLFIDELISAIRDITSRFPSGL
ncbi:MAG: hypothetical protein NC350_05625 [Corallococcus sp.]|nr:hypothetical protein [Corallococcus sp.]